MALLKPVNHGDQLSLVDHLDELRSRLIVSVVVFAGAFALCFWQNHLILDLLNAPLPDGRLPITLGVTEPFMTTLTVSGYGALIVSLPFLLYQAYAFLLPALSPDERRGVMPFLLMVPFLFIGGVVFSYMVVLPAAIDFLTNFNEQQFTIQIRAREYYGFVLMALAALGVLFQIPVGVLAATRLGITTPRQLRKSRRYAVLVIAVLAMLLPGTDPVTMLISMVPLLVLYEASIVLAAITTRRRVRGATTTAASDAS